MVLPNMPGINRSSILQMRRRRLRTLLNKLLRFCDDCYSDVSLTIAEYEISAYEQRQVTGYLTVSFSGAQQLAPDRSNLRERRNDRKATLARMLQRYSMDCYCDITASITELGLQQPPYGRWWEESRTFLLRSAKSSDTFPPSGDVLV